MWTPEKIAVIGLGRMGGGLTRNLAGRFDVTVFDIDAEATARCGPDVVPAETAVAAVMDADLVVTSLPLPEHVLATYRDVERHLRPKAVVMDTSTIDPRTASELASIVGNDRYVACSLGKGPAQAEAGEVPLFVGGPEPVLDDLEPVFACIGSTVHRLGSVEAATAFKIVSNLVGLTNLAVLAEGYALCRRAGVRDEAFSRALADTGGWSAQAELRLPWMIDDDFSPRFSVDLGLKDLGLAVSMAATWGIPTPVGAAGMAQLAHAAAHGHGAADVAAVLRVVAPG